MKRIVLIIALMLFILPIILSGDRYYLGGDDGGLYYLYPKEFIQNFASNIVTDNTIAGASMGYNPLFYFIPFLAFVYLLKQIWFINTQGLMYGLNMSLGFLFFYRFLGLWIVGKDFRTDFIKIISSLAYLFSPFLMGTLFLNQYTAIYMISILPATFYFLVRSILEDKTQFLIISILIFSIFSSILLTFPWWSAFALTFFPFIVYLFAKKPSIFIKYSIFGGITFFLINFYWIFHFLYSFITGGGGQSTLGFYSGSGIASENVRIAQGVSQLISPLNVIFQDILFRNPTEWSLLSFFNIFYLVVIVSAGFFIMKEKFYRFRKVYFLGLMGLILSWYLYSPNLGNWGPEMFIYLVRHVPFFGAFRNMYDKFSLSLSFFYAFTFAVGLLILTQRFKKIFRVVIIVFGFTLVVWVMNYVNVYFKKDIIDSRVSGKFDEEYLELMDYIKEFDNDSRIMWLPLNSPTYTYVKDGRYPESFYSGSSPTRILANKTDFSGRFSFIVPGDIFLGDRIVFDMLPNKEYTEVAKILQSLNVRHLIVDHRNLPGEIQDYYYDRDRKIINAQTPEFYSEILGTKLKDIGSEFSVYEINQSYMSDKITLKPKYTYQKLTSYSYLVKVEGLKEMSDLVFKEAFDDRWNLYLANSQKAMDNDDYQNIPAEFYGNKWFIDPEYIRNNYSDNLYRENEDGSLNLNLLIYFEPQKYVLPTTGVSMAAFTIFGVYSFWLLIKRSSLKRNV